MLRDQITFHIDVRRQLVFLIRWRNVIHMYAYDILGWKNNQKLHSLCIP